ncbi:hypothetical protein [Clostridium porci]|uniref:RHS repeat protein n=1 Tax=Clostridium porci TaxID=2605778 RepID=A0A7X2NPW4_9CLOT|nr:hypothetical protein [Clostridium porci]MSS38718.1 hypothetical protein [Clostridium porci]
MDRLVKEDRPEGGEEYSYDLNGNRLTRTSYHYALKGEKGETGFVCAVVDAKENYCYNEGNQLIERRRGKETTCYTYDANGSLVKEVTQKEQPEEGAKGGKKKEQATLYHYDFLNRQEKVELAEGKSLTAHYDGEGLRAGLTTREGESYTFLYYQGELIREEKAGEFYRSYLYGHGLAALES